MVKSDFNMAPGAVPPVAVSRVAVSPVAFVLAFSVLASSMAFAQKPPTDPDLSGEAAEEQQRTEDGDESDVGLRFEEEVVVTATRRESELLTVPGGVTVRNADELASEAARSFGNLFEGFPGVSIQGNARKITEAPNIRGFADEQVVIRLDGSRQNFNGAHGGRFFADPDLIERIEVVRGGSSSLYGSGALGGVISLATRSARGLLHPGERFGGRYRVGFQSNGRDLSHSLSGFAAGDRFDILGSVGWSPSGRAVLDGNRAEIPNTEQTLREALGKVGWTHGDGAGRLEFSYHRFGNEAAEPTNANALTGSLVDRDTATESMRARYRTRSTTSDLLDLNVLAYRNRVEFEEFLRVGSRRDDSTFETVGFELHNNARFRPGGSLGLTLGAGVEAYRDRQRGTRDGAPRHQFPDADVGYLAGWLHAEAEIADRFVLSGSLRRDGFRIRSDRFADRNESAMSPRASAGVRLGGSGFLWVAGSRAFRAPSLTELYADGIHFQLPLATGVQVVNLFQSTPDLGPERGASFEAGVRRTRGSLTGEAVCFASRVDGYVDQTVLFVDPAFLAGVDPATGDSILFGTTVNRAADARLDGCEAVAALERPHFGVRVAGSVLDTEDMSAAVAETSPAVTLSSAPANTLHVTVEGRLPSFDLTAGTRATFASMRSNVPALVEETPGYRVVDFFVRYRPGSGPLAGVDWTLALDNAFDEYFAIHPAVVPQPGRSLRIAAAYRFGAP